MPEWKTVPDHRVRREHMEDPDGWIGRLAERIAAAAVKATQERPGECVALTFRREVRDA